MKYVVAGLVIAVLIAWLMRSRAKPPADQAAERKRAAGGSAASSAAGTASMLRCAHCGVHLPGTDAIVIRGTPYCSDEHRRQAEADAS
jgi:uncharacterized protein